MAEIVRETVRTNDQETETPVKRAVSGTQTVERVIYFLFGALEVLLGFRLVFKLLGAGHGSAFVDAIYSLTRIFILPFGGIFPQATTTGLETIAILESATVIAIIVYAVLAWGIVALVKILAGQPEDAD